MNNLDFFEYVEITFQIHVTMVGSKKIITKNWIAVTCSANELSILNAKKKIEFLICDIIFVILLILILIIPNECCYNKP